MATGTVHTSLTANYSELGTTNMTTSTGSVLSGSVIRITWNDDIVIVNYYIRIQDPNGRPTITISGFPSIGSIEGGGSPTHMMVGTTNSITDASRFSHTSNTTTATINMFNFLGSVPSGSGYLVLSGTVAGKVW